MDNVRSTSYLGLGHSVVLALDYGTVRIGVAISRGPLAEPLTILPNNDAFFDKLVALIQKEKVRQIVVGASENQMLEKTKKFVSELKKKTDQPIFFTDETLSTHAVKQKLKDACRTARFGHVDHFAAAEILQSWLDER